MQYMGEQQPTDNFTIVFVKNLFQVRFSYLTHLGVLQGYNGTIMAYGQTTSGKTHTMIGDILSQDNKGIDMFAVEQLLDYSNTVQLKYNNLDRKRRSVNMDFIPWNIQRGHQRSAGSERNQPQDQRWRNFDNWFICWRTYCIET